ncbi:MAG: class III extradiol ring-cleavage dioxygenase [Pseudomonadota bacterium]
MQPTFFINHGGGPCFFLEQGPMRDNWRSLEAHLRTFASRLDEWPRAILIVSGHWEEDLPTVNTGPAPDLLFDYYGFPPHTYALSYRAPGAPQLAEQALKALRDAGVTGRTDKARGWDHGVFVPLMVMFPDADVPVAQLSLQRGLDPVTHLKIGAALRPLRQEGVLILGSGQSYHNMTGLSSGPDAEADAFDAWLHQANLDPTTREHALSRWDEAPGARTAHPHEDHLLPLMVAAGAASGEPGAVDFHGHAFGKPISGFRFG